MLQEIYIIRPGFATLNQNGRGKPRPYIFLSFCVNYLKAMTSPDAKILKLALPTPYPVGDINAYFIDGPEPCLIDAGLFFKKSLQAMSEQLAQLGRGLKDIRRIIITHDHIDHVGAALYLSQECKAVVFAHEKSELLAPWPEEARDQLYQFLFRCGAPKKLLDENLEAFKSAQKLVNLKARPFGVERLKGGDKISAGALVVQAIATPGHSPDHLCFFNPETRSLFCGDMILREITPNPLINLDPTDDYRHAPSLINYLSSLEKIDVLRAAVGYPGHGPTINDVPGLIASNRKFIEDRKKLFFDKIQAGSKTPFQLAQEIFGNLDAMNQLLGISEAVAYLDLLERDQKITVDWEGESISFEHKSSD